MATTITPDSGYGFASPQVYVDIYPHEGGSYTFNSTTGNIIAAKISKNIRDKKGGEFSLTLTPGGPQGINDPNSWTSILTPNSLVVISLVRSQSRRIVMVGILTNIEETQTWNNEKVIRLIKVAGMDFTYYFSQFSFYELTYLGLIGASLPFNTSGFILTEDGAQITGTPSQVAQLVLSDVMLGTGFNRTKISTTAVLENTFVKFQNNNLFLYELFSSWFEAFTENGIPLLIPVLTDLVNSEGSWYDKFTSFLAWPWYEFFVTTAEATDFPQAAGQTFDITKPNFTSVAPTIIGRVNPLPWIMYPPPGTSALGPVSPQVNNTRWEALNIYSLGSYSFIESTVNYNTDEVCNFFGITSIESDAFAGTAGTTNANQFGFQLLGGILDHYSINSYGFRPQFTPTRWLTLPVNYTPSNAAIPTFGIGQLQSIGQTLLGKFASYYIPTPNMLSGSVAFPMWPDIIPGSRFRYYPFKNGDQYEFYIEGVTHNYVFGGPSYTSIQISRGLRVSDYENTAVLSGLLLDTYARINGQVAPRPDVATNVGAEYVLPGSVPINMSPYYSGPSVLIPFAPAPAPVTP